MDYNNQDQNQNQLNHDQNAGGHHNWEDPAQKPNMQGGPYPYYVAPSKPVNRFANASIFFGIVAIVSSVLFTALPPFFFGSLGIIFALLSKGRQKKMIGNALAGFISSISGIVINVFIIGVSAFFLLTDTTYRESFKEQLDTTSMQLYGVPFDEMMDMMDPEDTISK
ncbi:MAG: hypothetical protein HGA25_00800 [Clostridiales bacterium]|nr:hypothetical protein [Clostridiales bacterium]